MSTITQRKKGWWKIWVLLAVICAVVAVAVVLYYVGYDYISWIGVDLMGVKSWASTYWMDAAIESFVWAAVGVLLTWVYFSYLRGNKVTVAPGAASSGYNPQPTTPTQPQNTDTTAIN